MKGRTAIVTVWIFTLLFAVLLSLAPAAAAEESFTAVPPLAASDVRSSMRFGR